MMRFVSVIKNSYFTWLPSWAVLAAFLSSVALPAHLARADIDIAALGGQSTMAEQGAICASFAALMENQSLINQNLGNLWSERRKFSGAVIRRAVELSDLATPSTDEIDRLINDYREWLLLNLSSQATDVSSQDYQTDVQNLIKTNCASLFIQADKAILRRYPELAYLINEAGQEPSQQSNEASEKTIDALLARNKELNVKLIALTAENASLKSQNKSALDEEAKEKIAATALPKPRPALPKIEDKTSKEKTPSSQQNEANTKKSPQTDTERFFAQLGSYSSQEAANAALNDLQKVHGTIFSETDLTVKSHQFASGKTLYRVRTENGSRALITSICDSLWKARMGCLIKTNIDS